jgi:NTE family protein
VINVDPFLKSLLDQIGVETFEVLPIPFYTVSTDFWSGEEVTIHSGKLLPAIKASMAIPRVFAPVEIDGRVLVDGSVPYDLLQDQCDVTLPPCTPHQNSRVENNKWRLQAMPFSLFPLIKPDVRISRIQHSIEE